MEIISSTVQTVVSFLILETIISHLVANPGFQKLLRMVCGVLLILLILRPVRTILQLDETAAEYLKSSELSQKLQQCEDIIAIGDEELAEVYQTEYEMVIQEQVNLYAEETGFEVVSCQAVLGENQEIEKLSLGVTDCSNDENIIEMVEVSMGNTKKESDTFTKIKGTVSSMYNISEQNVEIHRE